MGPDSVVTAPTVAMRARRGVVALVAAVMMVLAAPVPAAAAGPEWHIDRVGGPMSAAGVTVAVVDTGVDADHPGLAGRVLPQIDLVTEEPSKGDPNGHGTHVAGTVGAAEIGCDGESVQLGIAPDVRILPVRVLDSTGAGSSRTVADGIRRAADAGAHVINLSLGSDVVIRNVAGSGLEEAIEHAWAKGSVVVLAAGNDGVVGALFGSGYSGIPAMVVTATTHEDRVAPYATSIGSADWGISAPGGDGSGERGRDVLSILPGSQCGLKAGTSMAAPHVSGAVAVLRARGRGPRAAVDRLLETARPLGSSNTYGAGLVDLRAATAAPAAPAPTEPPPAPAPPPEQQPAPTASSPEDPPPSSAAPAPTSAPPAGNGTAPPEATDALTTTTDADTPHTASPTDEPDADAEEAPADDATDDTTDGGDELGSSAQLEIQEGDDGVPAALIAAAVGSLVAAGALSARLLVAGRRNP